MKTFGSDPELMLTKGSKVYSAIGIVQGSIENRISIQGHQFYYDNVLAECAIKPSTSKEETVANFRECLDLYAKMVRPYRLALIASHVYDNDQMANPEARKVGCAPDSCAYEMTQQDPPKQAIENGNLRSSGGHIHLGSPILASDGPEPVMAVYMLDLFLGVPSLWLDRDPTSARRRSLYGQAGRYRVKKYGIEYRSLGNFWLASPQMVELVYDLCAFVVSFVESGQAAKYWDFDWERVMKANSLAAGWECNGYDPVALRQGINTSNKQLVAPHFELAKSLLPEPLRTALIRMIDSPPNNNLYDNWGLKI